MKNYLRIVLFLTLLSLVSCGKKITPPPEPTNPKPEWMSKKPMTGLYYVGIGYANKQNESNYIQIAKKSALEDLISEIKVNVASTSVLQQIDDDESFKEKYESIIKTTAAEEVEEYELMDSWEDGTSYWAYYRLSKQKYKDIKAEKKRKAMVLATDFYDKGLEYESRKEITKAASAYLTALFAMKEYLADADVVTYKGEEIIISTEVYASIQRVLGKVRIKANDDKIVFEKRSQRAKNIKATVFLNSNDSRVKGFPVSGKFSAGSGVLHERYTTNENGEVTLIIQQFGGETKQRITLQPDLSVLAEEESKDPLVALITERIKIPQEQIELEVSKPSVYLVFVERILGEDKRTPNLTNKMKNLLSEKGFVFTNDQQRADLLLEISADTEEGGQKGNIFVSHLNLSISVVDNEDKNQIYGVSLDRIKGYSLDYERASREGYAEAIQKIEKETINELISAIL